MSVYAEWTLGFSSPFLLGKPPSRYAVSCLVCGALVIIPTASDVDPVEAELHAKFHAKKGHKS